MEAAFSSRPSLVPPPAPKGTGLIVRSTMLDDTGRFELRRLSDRAKSVGVIDAERPLRVRREGQNGAPVPGRAPEPGLRGRADPWRRASLVLIFLPLIVFNALCGIHLYKQTLLRTAVKLDYSRVNSLDYGLLSVDLWKNIIQKIVADRVTNFKITREQEKVFKREITKVLNALILEALQHFAKAPKNALRKPSETFRQRFVEDGAG